MAIIREKYRYLNIMLFTVDFRAIKWNIRSNFKNSWCERARVQECADTCAIMMKDKTDIKTIIFIITELIIK